MGERSKIKLGLTYVVCFAICFVLGLLWHEVMGHGLVGTLAGGHITEVEVLGVNLWPEVRWVGWSGAYAGCDVEDIPTAKGWYLHAIAGSLSTWCVAVLAVVLLWMRRWTGPIRMILVCLSLWCFDLLAYTSLSLGVPNRVFLISDDIFSEPYKAAIELGISGPLFQAFAVGTSICLLAGLILRLIYDHKQRKKQTWKKDGK